MARLLITGGMERENGFLLGEGKYYSRARLLRLDTDSGEVERLLEISEGGENYPEQHPNLQFTAGCVEGQRLWLPTDTEVHCYSYPDLSRLATISYPFFHNIHHVNVIDGGLYVVSTGLDLVVRLDAETFEPVEFLQAEGKDPWSRFSPHVDYRKIHSTRPHHSHPNYVFQVDGRRWLTRCTQQDAVCLDDPSRRFVISGGHDIGVHDGVLHEGLLYFSTVQGLLVVADPDTSTVVEEIDLLSLEPRREVKGWCRGILFQEEIVYVAYSRIRPTRDRRKVAWLRRFAPSLRRHRQAQVVAYDLKARKKVAEWLFPDDLIHAIYSILPEPAGT